VWWLDLSWEACTMIMGSKDEPHEDVAKTLEVTDNSIGNSEV
jgi:hypothetical protein